MAVSVVYVVWNGSTALNGTMASGLINQLTAELVGYFLFFPPMLIAERKFHAIQSLDIGSPYIVYPFLIPPFHFFEVRMAIWLHSSSRRKL